MKKILLAVVLFSVATSASAQSTSHTWIDITASPYYAHNDCSADAGTSINSAISGAPAGSGVIFFPTGCYLIKTQIVDTNKNAYLTYLAEGNVELRASTTNPPSNSIIQFGNNTTTVTLRKIVGINFNCYDAVIDGVDLDGLADSEFDGITIQACKGSSNWHMRTVGTNANQYNNVFLGGLIDADAKDENGISLGTNSSTCTAANAWSFFGTKIINGQTSGLQPTGTGLELDGTAITFHGGAVSQWYAGINLSVNSPCSAQGAFSISGAYIENNAYAGIRVGGSGYADSQASGVAITGNYINCGNVGSYGVDVQQSNGYFIAGNRIQQCTTNAIRGLGDGTYQGADNGFVGANFINGGQPVTLQGSNTTVTASLSTKSSAYTLTGTDTWVNATGTTTITVPHAMTAQRWDVFNSGTGTVTLICDSGTINGATSITVASEIGKTVTTDGTSCFAH
jgi:hypothetical protein